MIEAHCSSEWPSRRSPCRTLALAAFIAIAGCHRSDPAPEASATPEVAEDSHSTKTAAVKALSALGRAEILAAVAAAADEVAAGNALPKSNLELANRSFELTMPIACEDGATGGWGSWSFDPATKVLRVSFSRPNWAAEPLFADMGHFGRAPITIISPRRSPPLRTWLRASRSKPPRASGSNGRGLGRNSARVLPPMRKRRKRRRRQIGKLRT